MLEQESRPSAPHPVPYPPDATSAAELPPFNRLLCAAFLRRSTAGYLRSHLDQVLMKTHRFHLLLQAHLTHWRSDTQGDTLSCITRYCTDVCAITRQVQNPPWSCLYPVPHSCVDHEVMWKRMTCEPQCGLLSWEGERFS